MYLIPSLIFLCVVIQVKGDYAQRVEEKKLIDSLVLPSKYEKEIRPSGLHDGPTIITMSMFVRDIYNFHPGTQTMNVQITFRQQWMDERLKFDDKGGKMKSLSLPGTGSSIWTPDVFFSNERDGRTHDLLKPNVHIRILPSGQVFYSRRITLKVTCQMCLKDYPFDRQNCSMKIASYGMTSSDLVFKWKDSNSVQVAKNLVLRNFEYKEVKQEECTGEFTCLRAIFNFDRIIYPHFTQLFLPSILIHLVSWIPFWLPSSSHSSLTRIRVLVSFLSFLFLTWFCVTSESTRSPDAYEFNPKDIWVGSVLVLTFVSFLHICILECGSEDGQRMGRRGSEDNPFKPHFSENLVLGRRQVNTSKIACGIYPVLFIAFNVAYWTYFLKNRD